MNLAALLAEAAQQIPGDSPLPDARLLLARALSRTRTWVLAHPDYTPAPTESRLFDTLLSRAASGEPLPYILGEWEFFGLPFTLTPDVLIPRPETELLVERALARIRGEGRQSAKRRAASHEVPLDWPDGQSGQAAALHREAAGVTFHRTRRRSPLYGLPLPPAPPLPIEASPPAPLAADIGTGSGCIAITLAHSVPGLRLFATDLSPAALQVARANAKRHHVTDRITFLEGDLLAPLPEAVHLICANLPYIPTATLDTLAVSHTEPRLALDGGVDGLDLIRRLLAQAPTKLHPGGVILLEIETSQRQSALALARSAFPDASITLHRDLAGLDRLIEIETE